MIQFEDIKEAANRIAPYIIKTPLFRVRSLDDSLNCEVYVKAECMQLTGSFKLRGALNKALKLSKEELKNGLVCASSGNHGRAVSYVAKMLGTKATVVVPDTASPVKKEAIRSLGATLVLSDVSKRFEVAETICSAQNATLIHPYNDWDVMAGQGTLGLELAGEGIDFDAVVLPVSGGGLISGVSCAVKSLMTGTKVYGAEPSALPRYSVSLAKKEISEVPAGKTLADALVSLKPGDKCFPVVREYVDGVFPVEDFYMVKALKLLLSEAKILAEPSSCIGMGAALQGLLHVRGQKVCFVVSGGNVGLNQLSALIKD